MKKAVIIGSGVAGIAASIRLAQKGYDTRVFEANRYPGGKLTAFKQGSYRFDAGPSLFTLPKLVDELFELCSENPRHHFNYREIDTPCVYFWEDGTVFMAPSKPSVFAQKAAKTFNVDEKVVNRYLTRAARLYEATSPIFLEQSLHQFKNYFRKEVFRAALHLPDLALTKTMNTVNQGFFKDPKLVQLFNRYATYNGSNPYKAPGVLTMIPHLEHGKGTWLPKGGMHEITLQLKALAERQGVKFQFNTPVTRILTQGKKAVGVELQSGAEVMADTVFCNMDVVPAYRRLLKNIKAPEKTLNQERSGSALIFYWGIKREFPQLDLHNIFFAEDYKAEFDSIFEDKEIYSDPTVYVNITSKYEAGDAPEGCENWFVMVNAPGDYGDYHNEAIQRARSAIINKLNRVLKTNVEKLIEVERVLDPPKIEAQTSSYKGALYGAASNNSTAAFFRHPNFSNRIQNLHFCGGSVHPGGGIPLCLNSAKIAVQTMKSEKPEG